MKIREQWWTVVGFDNLTIEYTIFASAKILLVTHCFHYIKGCVYLSIRNEGYHVYVKKVNNESVTWLDPHQCNRQKSGVDNSKSKLVVSAEGDQLQAHEMEVGSWMLRGGISINNEVEHVVMGVGKAITTRPHLEMKGSNYCALNPCTENLDRGEQENCSKCSTVGLDDDRQTVEVMKNLGLEINRPNKHNKLAKAFENGLLKNGVMGRDGHGLVQQKNQTKLH